MRPEKLLFFVEKLLDSNFGKQNSHIIDPNLSFTVYSKLNHCFKNISRKYYRNNLKNFDLLNSDHLCICLYLFSNELFKIKKYELAKKFFLLNKMINGIDLFYKVNMPRIFMFCHPQSSVIGNGKFSDYCIFFQNVTIGRKGKNYPKFSQAVIFYPGSKIIGNCKIGKNVIFGPDSSIVDTDIPSNTLVLGKFPNIVLKKNNYDIKNQFFKSTTKIKI